MRLPCSAAVFLTALVVLSGPVTAQGGYAKEEHLEHGIRLERPRNHVPIPIQPTEKWVVLKYAERIPRNERKRKKIRPEYLIVRIDWVPDPEPEPEPAPHPDPGDDDEERTRSRNAEEKKEKKPPPPPISTLERYVDQRLKGWELGAESRRKDRDGFQGFEYELERTDGKGSKSAFVYAWRRPVETVALIGFCGHDDYKKQSKIWRTVAESMEFFEPEAADMIRWERFYARNPKLKDPEFRIEIRRGLVGDWEADDTENYIFVFSTKKEKLIRSLKQEMEAIRKAYEELFPPAEPVTAVSTVRICRDQADYMKYGGMAGSGGYWNSVAEELVFFDYQDRKNERGSGKANSRIVLYHEAFHQYIYYSTGELAPHSWFNEGYGDFFSGARFNRYGEVSKIDVNPWRVGTIQRAIARYDHAPWKDIIRFEQKDYYRRSRRGLNYAQGWSMIYFLNTSKQVAKRPEWAGILTTYFDTLKETWIREQEQLEKSGQQDDREQVAEGRLRSREAAVEAAFQDVDLDEIEESWMKYTLSLKPPK
ncbi:MAG: DUF1570 domain-containing protein [Planctomycetota bacterium]|nr:DUF1570 domain-containing protein [Planctomycetota bacterium]